MNPESNRARTWFEAGDADASTWRGDVELGTLSVTGNTQSVSTHGRLRIQNDRPRWTHTFRYEVLFAQENEVTTTDQTRASQKSAFKLTADDYLFETVRYERNPFQGFRYRFSEVLGYGRRLVASETVRLFLEAGPGARQTRHPDNQLRNEAQAYFSGELDWDLSQQANLNWLVVVEATDANTITDSHLALSAKLGAGLSMKASHRLVHNSTVPAGVAATDTITSFTLVYTF